MHDAKDPSRRVRIPLLFLLVAMATVLFFARLPQPLLEPEEARYAEIPRQMLAESRFLVPVLHGEDYWQKPPLLYWLVMLSYQLFGVHDWAARLIPCVSAVCSVIIVTCWGWRTVGFWTGYVSGTILALSARFVYLAGMLSLDGLLCTFVLAGLACGHIALIDSSRKRWLILAALACALAIMVKGPVALVLIVVPLLAFAWLEPHHRFGIAESVTYLASVALLAGPWFVVMIWKSPDAAGTFFWLHHFVRYVAPFDHEKPVWFYGPSLLLGMIPWSLLLFPMLPYLCGQSPSAQRRRPASLKMFVLAGGFCVLFFSLSGCKRPGYILPALPLFSLMLGTYVTHGLPWRRWVQANDSLASNVHQWGHRWGRRLMLTTILMVLVVGGAGALRKLWPWSGVFWTALPCAFALVAIFFWPQGWAGRSSLAASVGIVFLFLVYAQLAWLPAYHERFGLRRQVDLCLEYQQEQPLPIFCCPKRWDSVCFYLQRNDINSYPTTAIDKLVSDLRTHGKALIFTHRDQPLENLLRSLPNEFKIDWCELEEHSVKVGFVRHRARGWD